MPEQRIFRVGVGRYIPPEDATIEPGDLVQLDPVIYSGGGVGIVMTISPNGGWYDVHTETKEISIHRSWLHKVGRARFWPDGKPVEDTEIAHTVWGRVPIAS